MVEIINHVTDPRTDEGEGSIKIAQSFKDYFTNRPDIDGRIDIFPSVIAFGQKGNVKDVDLFLICEFSGYCLPDFIDIDTSSRDVLVKNFACTIELKRHGFSKIERRGSDVWVHYNNCDENASDQSKKAKFALKNYIVNKLGRSPFIFNFVWLWNIDQAAVSLLDNGDGLNLLPSSFTFEDLVRLSFYQREAYYDTTIDQDIVSSWGYSLYDGIVELLSKVITLPEGLTYNKINDLNSTEIDKFGEYSDIGNKLTIVSGRAGTGKTFTLLKYAISIAKERDACCLILTYNKALVSDIRRLLAFMHIPSGIKPKSVQILTMDQFFFQLSVELGIINGRVSQEEFNNQYEDRLLALHDKIDSFNNKTWNYVFVDEGQDWSLIQKDILVGYFGVQNIIKLVLLMV